MLLQNFFEALGAIFSNRLRTVLTILIIAFGILAIVGVLTSIDGIKYWMRSSFSTLGANTFVIQNRATTIRVGRRAEQKNYPAISLKEAQALKRELKSNVTASINVPVTFAAQAKAGNRKTYNNMRVNGTDENFLQVESYELADGRTISEQDILNTASVAVVGARIKNDLFPNQRAVGQTFFVGRKRYTIIGLLAEKGAAFGASSDRVIQIPITTALADFPDKRSMALTVQVQKAELIEPTMATAIGKFRIIRGLGPGEENNFAAVVSDSFVDNLMDNLKILTLSATVIAIITLFGAVIGLMNIMLVSVTERTREIGVRKAMGATSGNILQQFLTEAVTISLLGGMVGIVFGVLVGNLVGVFLNAPFFIPWLWVGVAIVICIVVGIVSGIYPARKAARLDPIDSLRYE